MFRERALPQPAAFLAQALAACGRRDEGRAALREAAALVEETGERCIVGPLPNAKFANPMGRAARQPGHKPIEGNVALRRCNRHRSFGYHNLPSPSQMCSAHAVAPSGQKILPRALLQRS